MIVSIHIPKTAGTALAKILDETSSRKIMYDYGAERSDGAWMCPPEIRENRDFIRGYFKYLHGHFHYRKYAEVFADCPFIATVRNPVDRVISQYLHIRRAGDRNFDKHRPIMDGEMSVAEFARREEIGNAQSEYLKGRTIADYDFIFVQERLDESLRKFAAKFSLAEITRVAPPSSRIPLVNVRPSVKSLFARRAEPFSRAERREIARHCERDNEVYRLALETLRRR